jgi:hypothetical protein
LTGLLLAGIAVLAISSCPAWGGIVNGDFSDGLTGWEAIASPDDPLMAVVEVANGQLHMRIANTYDYNEATGWWDLRELQNSGAGVHRDFFPNEMAPLGTTGLQFDADVQISGNGFPVEGSGAVIIIEVDYAGKQELWFAESSTSGPQTISLPFYDEVENTPVLEMFLTAFTTIPNVTPDPELSTSYNIVLDVTFDNFKFVPVPDGELVNVLIDIKPGDSANHINLGSNGGIPVAILGTETFDVLQVDPLSVTLADAGIRIRGKGKSIFSTSDVNGDGLLDMILSIETEGLSLAPDATEAVLKGMTYDGLSFQGSDYVMIVGQNSTSSMTLSPLPEPSSIMLLILGGMSVIRRRRLRGKNGN